MHPPAINRGGHVGVAGSVKEIAQPSEHVFAPSWIKSALMEIHEIHATHYLGKRLESTSASGLMIEVQTSATLNSDIDAGDPA